MSAPNHFAIVQGMANDYPQLLEENSYDSIREFMMMLAGRLVEEDPAWGYLTKDPGEKHIVLPDNQRVSVDSFIYRPTQQVVDMLTNAMETEGQAGPAWQEKEKRPNNNWWEITLRNSKPSEDSGGGDSGGDSQKDSEQDQKIAALEARVAALEAVPPGNIDGKHIALRAQQNDKYLRGRFDTDDPVVAADSDVSQSYETFIIKDMG